MHYVYLLISAGNINRRYIGITTDLKRRLAEHNSGKSPHTAQFKPWHLVTYVAFSNEPTATEVDDRRPTHQGSPAWSRSRVSHLSVRTTPLACG